MTFASPFTILNAFAVIVFCLLLSICMVDTALGHNLTSSAVMAKQYIKVSRVFDMCVGIALYKFIKLVALERWVNHEKSSVYGLQHGRLHLQVPTAMWMNMGYWKDSNASLSMAEASRNLLDAVLAQAGFSSVVERAEVEKGARRVKCLIDLGFGCGDQTMYLMSTKPVRPSDEIWWDAQEHCVRFDYYVGITNDPVQARYASKRVEKLKNRGNMIDPYHQYDHKDGRTDIALFCADAAKPTSWDDRLQATIQNARDKSQERWVLALDTAYHFAHSRWPLINHTCLHIGASFMAFDLCLSHTATVTQKFVLRLLTALMGAPWANFITPQEYQKKLIQAGYRKDMITIKDISEHVFIPLTQYLDKQDERLRLLGLGIGKFRLAKAMFNWWGRTGVVRGVIVTARKSDTENLR